jgi:hypothetical protein
MSTGITTPPSALPVPLPQGTAKVGPYNYQQEFPVAMVTRSGGIVDVTVPAYDPNNPRPDYIHVLYLPEEALIPPDDKVNDLFEQAIHGTRQAFAPTVPPGTYRIVTKGVTPGLYKVVLAYEWKTPPPTRQTPNPHPATRTRILESPETQPGPTQNTPEETSVRAQLHQEQLQHTAPPPQDKPPAKKLPPIISATPLPARRPAPDPTRDLPPPPTTPETDEQGKPKPYTAP